MQSFTFLLSLPNKNRIVIGENVSRIQLLIPDAISNFGHLSIWKLKNYILFPLFIQFPILFVFTLNNFTLQPILWECVAVRDCFNFKCLLCSTDLFADLVSSPHGLQGVFLKTYTLEKSKVLRPGHIYQRLLLLNISYYSYCLRSLHIIKKIGFWKNLLPIRISKLFSTGNGRNERKRFRRRKYRNSFCKATWSKEERAESTETSC